MSKLARFGWVILAAALAGCSSSTETGGGAGTPAGTFDHDVLECGAPQLCTMLSWQSYAPPNPPIGPTAEEYVCALESLRDRTPSLLVTSYGCEGMCSGDVFLIRPDGTALRQGWMQAFEGGIELDGIMAELQSWEASGESCNLEAPAFYDACDPAVDDTCDSTSAWFVGCVSGADKQCGL